MGAVEVGERRKETVKARNLVWARVPGWRLVVEGQLPKGRVARHLVGWLAHRDH